ncbi:helix-turn-helix transcriptional regulator [Listeria monocytogenes]|uniref:helix-turn-helix domain-containing protein n=1 Tax=Listeria TaxID=1637 RepID=UPI0011EACB3D|nr:MULTISPECIES: helix-turn-helix transcriptional regulator [Listeria]EHD1589104.1 helix-turn-helix transcriptional regulator [Listeria monocytogenes]EHK4067737.1 helix-turn-helix transcriptional regulator [Listeria monocytogenes]MBC1339383.1 helix-turn-helix transcriptional regulator [Listeria innocua]MBC1353530.1 helix-turn-helix transcriptional regulator [Listeria innocua]MBC2137440.1 helix-turn-helix transcriptional regulator [Listeria innocua]
MNIGDKLKQTRKKGGFTQDEISQQIHVSRQTISSWENSKSLPDVTSLILLSDIYSLSLDDLIKGDYKMINEIRNKEKLSKDRYFLNKIQLITSTGLFLSFFLYLLESLLNVNTYSSIPLLMLVVGILNFVPYSSFSIKNEDNLIHESKNKISKSFFYLALSIIVGFIGAFLFSKLF